MEERMSKEKKSVWETLSAIDVKDKTKKKGSMTYLPWAWAWGELKKKYPEATFKKHIHDGMAYIKDEKGNTFVEVTVTVEGISATELYPVTDNKYNAILNPDAFEVNTAFQRALVKAIAYHGLGHHLYAGEDVPEGNAETPQSEGKAKEVVDPIQEATPTPPPPTEPPTEIDLDEVKEDWSMLTDAFHQLINAHESKDTLAKLWGNNEKALKLLKEKRPNDYQEVYEAFEKRGKYLKEKTNG
jgi:hypothetical protein